MTLAASVLVFPGFGGLSDRAGRVLAWFAGLLPGKLADAALVRLVREGGEPGKQAYSALVQRHRVWLVRYLLYLLHDPGTAEDIAQEVFVRGFLRIEQFKGGSFKAWLRKIATNLAFNHHRDRRVAREYEEEAMELLAERLSGPQEHAEIREALLKAFAQVPYAIREVLVLRFVEELSVAEIARVLHIGESAAKMRLLRARQDFAQVWNSEVGDEEAS